jgi:glycosyltransferase involved in cell wall biosynthesis
LDILIEQENVLRILQIIGNLDIGGAQEVVRTLAKYLEQCGQVPVVCSFKDGPLRQEIERMGIPVEILPKKRYSILAFPQFVVEMIRLRKALAGLVEKYQIDVIQTHLLRSLDFLVLTLRLEAKRPLVFWTVHNDKFTLQAEDLPELKWLLIPKRWAHLWLYRLASIWVDGFIAVSPQVEASIMKDINPIRKKVTTICNGVDVSRYTHQVDRAGVRARLGLSESDCLVIVVGTLKEQKGHRILIEAAPEIIDRYPRLQILLVGDGALRAELQTQVSTAGIDRHVSFLGTRGDIPELLGASDLFVLPSLWEGLPMALIEAMASGLPIVATSVSGTRQVMVSGETGLLVPPGDPIRLKEAIIFLLADQRRAKQMGHLALRRIEASFSARKQAEDHIALYRTVGRGVRNAWHESI